MLDEEREISTPPTHFFEECKQSKKYRLGIDTRNPFIDSDVEQHRHQSIEALARQRRKLRVSPAGSYALQRDDQRARIAVTSVRKSGRGVGRFLPHTRKCVRINV